MGKTKVFLCSEEETVELGEARVELEFEDRPRELPIELSAVILRDVDFPAESAADAAVTSLQADVEFYQKNSDYWHKTYNLLMEQRRRDWSERVDLVAQNDELRSEVERLRQSRKEQAEKHRQKMRNLQMNFEQLESGQVRNQKLKKRLDQAKDYSHRVERVNKGLREEIEDLKADQRSLADQLEEARISRGKFQDDAAYWHEKYLETEKAFSGEEAEGLAELRESWKRVNRQRIDFAAENQLLRTELKKADQEKDDLLSQVNCLLEGWNEAASTINYAVEDWNEFADE